MKIAITGNTGFIGKNLETFFKKKKYEVITLGRNKSNDIKFDLFKKNLRLLKFKKKIDILIHCASISVNEFYRKKKLNKSIILKIIESELQSLEDLIKFCKKNNIKKFIFISSSSVYGKNPNNKSFKTSEIANPSDLYGALKLAMEIIGSKLFKNFISLRLFQVYGLNDLKFRLIPTLINSNKVNLKNCCQVTDLIFYKDLNSLILKLILSKKINSGTYNAGNGQPVHLKKIVDKIIQLKKEKTHVKYEKKLPKISNYSFADKNEIYKDIKWKPKYDITSGLRELINEYES